jgi:hypothetical protein
MVDFKNPKVNPKTEIECMSCRRFYIYHFDRYHPDYDGLAFDQHFCNCSFCQALVKDYNSNPNNQIWQGIDLWNSNPKQPTEKQSELDRMLKEETEKEYR